MVNYAQAAAPGVTGIYGAAADVRSFYKSVTDLIMAIGGLVGLVGGLRVYIKWNSGDRDITPDVMSWVGSSIFLLLVSVVMKSMFL